MAVKTLADINTQLSTGGSSGRFVEQDLIKDIVDSFAISTDLDAYKTEASLLQAAQADSVAADTAAMVVDFNLLLAKLRLAGIITP